MRGDIGGHFGGVREHGMRKEDMRGGDGGSFRMSDMVDGAHRKSTAVIARP